MDSFIFYLAAGLGTALVVRAVVSLVMALQRLAQTKRVYALETAAFTHQLAATQKVQKQRAALANTWSGNRKFAVSKVVKECTGVKSFYLKPHDGKNIPAFKPGQFLTFNIPQPNSDKRVNRCYSLSNGPGLNEYRVSIKQVPDGLVSNWSHANVKKGTILDVKAAAGGFFLDTTASHPVVLIAGGVGITPMMSMLMAIASTAPAREVWLFYGIRSKEDHILKKAIEETTKSLTSFHRHICYSRPTKNCKKGRKADFDHEGRVTLDLIKSHLKTNNFHYYLCGPSQMMTDLVEGLRAWGVPEKDIHREAFGPASVGGGKKKAPSEAAAPAKGAKVEFARSGKVFDWKPTDDEASILKLACDQDIKTIDASGCHAGNCGTCQTAIQSGEVDYLSEPGCQVENGSFLPCIAVPKGELKIDA